MFPMHWEPSTLLKKLLKKRTGGAVVLVDGAQSLFTWILMCRKWIVISLFFLLIKLYGPTGVGVLYGKNIYWKQCLPFQGGGEMIKEVTFEKTTYNDLPYKYEAGTPNIADTVAFKAALDFIKEIGKENIRKHEE